MLLTACVLSVQSYNELKDGVAAGSTLGILTDFLYLFVASLALGMLFGLGTAFLLKFLQSDSSPQEVRAPLQRPSRSPWLPWGGGH